MAKRRKNKRRSKRRGSLDLVRKPMVDLMPVYEEADALIDGGRADEAVALLMPLLTDYPRDAGLHYHVGYALAQLGDALEALVHYEQAQKLGRDPTYWLPIAALYLALEFHAHALHALRQAVRLDVAEPDLTWARQNIIALEEDIAAVTGLLGLNPAKAEQGLRHMEAGMRALQTGDMAESATASRRAVAILGNWPPPNNNLFLALFYGGHPQQAFDVALKVLADHPDNIQALGNLIRFLAWSNRVDEARAYWPRLLDAEPTESNDIFKVAEAAADLGEDQVVLESLMPYADLESAPLPVKMVQLLATALANTGQRDAALSRMRPLTEAFPWLVDSVRALEEGRPGPRLAQRFPYHHSAEMMPVPELIAFAELSAEEDGMPQARFRKRVETYLRRYPQLEIMAEKTLWEEGEPEAGMQFLAALATPGAFAALRHFATSKAGDDGQRREAITILQRAGQIPRDASVRLWQEGVWQEVVMQTFEIVDDHDVAYAPPVADRLNRGVAAMHEGRLAEAERHFLDAVKRDPTAKEGFNNLAALYSQQDHHEEAKAMLQRAIAVEPAYVMARVNLAKFCLVDDDIDGAKEWLASIEQSPRFTREEFILYQQVQSRIALAEKDFEQALQAANIVLEIDPDNQWARKMANQLDVMIRLSTNWENTVADREKRDRAKRLRMQTTLTSNAPRLDETLSLFTKDVMAGMARLVLPQGGWSGLRKAELSGAIVDGLLDEHNLASMVAELTDDEREALGVVLANGGAIAWQTFSERYGDDMEESPHWEYRDPETLMGRLRQRGLLAEATVDGDLLVVVPLELRTILAGMVG